MKVELVEKGKLSPEQSEYMAERLNDPDHRGDKGPPDVWDVYEHNLYAIVSLEKRLPVGIIEVTLNYPPRPGWWIDSQFRKKGYGKAAMDKLAKLLVDAGVPEIGEIAYRGQCQVGSKKLGKYLEERFTFYRRG